MAVDSGEPYLLRPIESICCRKLPDVCHQLLAFLLILDLIKDCAIDRKSWNSQAVIVSIDSVNTYFGPCQLRIYLSTSLLARQVSKVKTQEPMHS